MKKDAEFIVDGYKYWFCSSAFVGQSSCNYGAVYGTLCSVQCCSLIDVVMFYSERIYH